MDAFSDEAKKQLIKEWRSAYGDEKIDLLIYSVAAPKRTDPKSGEVYSSVIKPIGQSYHNKTLDFHTGEISEISVAAADENEITQTIKVMGGEDWQLWIEALLAEGLLSSEIITVAFSYIGPKLTHAIYRDGTIGKAKDDLLQKSFVISDLLKPLNGEALVSVNKAIVTQSSAAIPVVTLYVSLLYKIMKENGTHEDKLDQMMRLFFDNLYTKDIKKWDNNLIRLDDLEMAPEVQAMVTALWGAANSENIEQISDVRGYREEFFSLFGFGRNDVDYDADVVNY
jgi:enoyl-[acyl-carrier protein] reductase/trans-2-enoyl-CoA reductase (NAD+)